MKTTVISLGGSLIHPGQINLSYLQKLRTLVLEYIQKNRLILVCGGGYSARSYQAAARSLGITAAEDLDWVGIMATRLNAELIRVFFKEEAYEQVIIHPEQKITTEKNLIIGAGTFPGWTTDYDAVLLAKKFKADFLVNASNIDYVYTKDPKKYKDAKKMERLSWPEFKKLVGTFAPGMHAPFDPVASRYAENEGMKVAIINGLDLANLRLVLEGKPFKGTILG